MVHKKTCYYTLSLELGHIFAWQLLSGLSGTPKKILSLLDGLVNDLKEEIIYKIYVKKSFFLKF